MTSSAAFTSVSENYLANARSYVDADCRRYGLPSSGPLYQNLLAYLVNPDAHDFRLGELPGLTGDPGVLSQPRRILDLGCGPGTLVWKALRCGHDAHGIDLSEEKIALGKLWSRAMDLPAEWEGRVRIEDGGRLPYAGETFDLVTSYHVLEHVADLPSVLYEAVRVTKRGGWLELRAPDYRMSYDTHYCMAWPRFMPHAQAEKWCDAMMRPRDGIGTFYYVTGPQVISLLESLGCRVNAVVYREHRDGRVFASDGSITADPAIFAPDADVTAIARELLRLQAENRLPAIYKTCLEFTIAAQRL